MPTPSPGLSISELSAQAGSFALGPLSIAIPPDRVLVVLGPSGAGKTMLLETIAGLRAACSSLGSMDSNAMRALLTANGTLTNSMAATMPHCDP